MKKEIITKFYDAFSEGDYETLKTLYSKDIIFNDEIFKNLDYLHVTSMWEMLLKNRENNKFNVTYEVVDNDDEAYVIWTAKYLFGEKKRKVKNVVTSKMKVIDGKIVEHTDSFKFKKWARQCFGIVGTLFGKRKWFIKKIQNVTNVRLDNFIKEKKSK